MSANVVTVAAQPVAWHGCWFMELLVNNPALVALLVFAASAAPDPAPAWTTPNVPKNWPPSPIPAPWPTTPLPLPEPFPSTPMLGPLPDTPARCPVPWTPLQPPPLQSAMTPF